MSKSRTGRLFIAFGLGTITGGGLGMFAFNMWAGVVLTLAGAIGTALFVRRYWWPS